MMMKNHCRLDNQNYKLAIQKTKIVKKKIIINLNRDQNLSNGLNKNIMKSNWFISLSNSLKVYLRDLKIKIRLLLIVNH